MDLSATKDCHCLAARRRARAITRLYEETHRPHGLQATQFSVLAALARTGPIPLGELADLLGLERTTLTRSANRLGDDGWVAEAESDDARVRRLKQTHVGRQKVESTDRSRDLTPPYHDLNSLEEDQLTDEGLIASRGSAASSRARRRT